MKTKLQFLPALLGCVLIFCLLCPQPGQGAQIPTTITLSPSSDVPGTEVVVTGKGWWSNIAQPPFEIHWNKPDGKILGTFKPDTSGNWSTRIIIPETAQTGDHEIWACAGCNSKPLWAAAVFKVILLPTPTLTRTPPSTPTPASTIPPTPTITPLPPTDCDATGMEGELVIDFERFELGLDLKDLMIPEGILFSSDQSLIVVDPVVETHSGEKALRAAGAMEFGSQGLPVHLEFTRLPDFVGVYVGLDEAASFNQPFTASMKAYGMTETGARYFIGEDSVTLGTDPEAVKKCLSVSGSRIYEVFIDYERVGNLELMDDLILRGPLDRPTIPVDDLPPRVFIETPENNSKVAPPAVKVQGEIYEEREIVKVEFIVNDELFITSGAFSLGEGPEGWKKFGFLLNGIPPAQFKECINVIEVRAYDKANNMGRDYVNVRNEMGTLSIENVEPVQVLYNAPLVKGKGTAFRTTFTSEVFCETEVSFKLNLPENMWSREPLSGQRIGTVYGVPVGWQIPEITLPLSLPSGYQHLEVMLPIVPGGMEKSALMESTNPAGLLGTVRQVPRPIADQVHFSVEIDPENKILEMNEGDNTFTSPMYDVVTTRPFKVVYVPWFFNFEPPAWETLSYYEYYLTYAGYPDLDARMEDVHNTLFEGKAPLSLALKAEEIQRMKNTTDQFGELFLGSFPIADGKYSYSFESSYVYFREDYYEAIGVTDLCDSRTFILDVREDILEADPSVDYVILELPTGCCGQSHPVAAYVDGGIGLANGRIDWPHYCVYPPPDPENTSTPTPGPDKFPFGGAAVDTVIHESAHVWNGATDCYGCERGDPPDRTLDCSTCFTDEDGFWVNGWQSFSSGEQSFMWYVDPSVIRWWRMEPMVHTSGSLYGDGYLNMVEAFEDVDDPQVLLVKGSVTRSGQASLGSFKILENGRPDYPPGAEGDYAFVLKDAAGKELSRTGFYPMFEISDSLTNSIIQLEEAGFLLRLTWDPATRKIELQDREGKVLAERSVSVHPPQVTILQPAAGVTLPQNGKLSVEWTTSDADGDAVLSSVHFSQDNGESWDAAGTNLTETRFSLPLALFQPGDQVLIRVMVTDGVNTSMTVAANPVLIAAPQEEVPSIKQGLILYYAAAAVLVLVILIALVLLRRRKKRQQ